MNMPVELPTQPTCAFQQNHLLASLTQSDWSQIKPYLEQVDFSLNQVLCESGKTPSYMYFPTTAIVSLLYMTESGASSEVAVIGNDGAVGMSLFFSGSDSPNQALVQTAGKGYRIRAQAAKNAINRSDAMLNILLHYSQAMITQVTQTAVCNRHHTIDQQLCRRLLISLDRLPTNQIATTQEMLGNILGVRRESVTQAALNLQNSGIISYKRGLITVLDREALESRSCECYAITKSEQLRLENMPLHH
ncbi:MAG: Crp/Fnr family transcriptional regulator [Methylophilus sp.]